MRRSIHTTLLVLLLAVAGASATAAAPAKFGGKVCQLLGSKQAVAIHGLSSRCADAKPSQGPGSTIYIGTWAAKSGRVPSLQVTVTKYADAGMLKLATSNLKQGLPGPPRRVSGIGGGAYEAVGAGSAGLRFVKGKYTVLVLLSASGTPAAAAVEAAARSIAAKF